MGRMRGTFRQRCRFFGIGGVLAFCWLLSSAAEAAGNRWTHYGVRPLGMGNAFVAVVDDYNALFYNPAGLARLKDWDLEIFNPHLAISQNTLTLGATVSELLSNSSNTDAMLKIVDEQLGTNHYAEFGVTPYWVFQGFGLAIGWSNQLALTFDRAIAVDVLAVTELITPISYAKSFLGNALSVGASLKVAIRSGVDREFSIEEIGILKKDEETGEQKQPKISDYVQGGLGFGVDFGLLYTPSNDMDPTFGLSLTDLGGTPYAEFQLDQETSLGKPAPRLPSVNTGVSLKPLKTSWSYLLVAVDTHSINQPTSFSKKFHYGTEFGLGDHLKFQTGAYQGELTGGFQLDIPLLTIKLATYTEQLGTVAGADEKLRDRRFVAQVKLLL